MRNVPQEKRKKQKQKKHELAPNLQRCLPANHTSNCGHYMQLELRGRTFLSV